MNDFMTGDFRVFDMFARQWALATAGEIGNFNTCTIAWGGLGVLWRKPVATIYVHPARYTCQFLKENPVFTVSFFPEEYQKALGYLGSHSGRDGDKVKASGLKPEAMRESVTFEEANLVFYCEKLCQQQFARQDLAPEIRQFYESNPKSFPPDADGQWQPHWAFTGEITGVRDRR